MPADIRDRFSVLPLQCLISHVFNYSSIIISEQTGANYRLEAINSLLSFLIRLAKLEEMILIVRKFVFFCRYKSHFPKTHSFIQFTLKHVFSTYPMIDF